MVNKKACTNRWLEESQENKQKKKKIPSKAKTA